MGSLNENKKNQWNYSLDLLKFISSFMIVCINFKFFGEVGKFVTVISRFAVPVFFMISGYYSCNDDLKAVKDKIIRIMKMYIFAVVLYFCFNVIVKVLSGQYKEAIWYVSTYLRFRYTSKTILFNESITAMHIWFLGALIYSYGIRYLVIRFKVKENIINILSFVLLVINIALGIGMSVLKITTPSFLLHNYILRNFLFMGFPLFTIGRLINKKEDVILNVLSCKILVFLVLLSVADAVLMWKVDWTKDLYAGSILMAVTLFVIALKMKDKTYHPNVNALFNTSTLVYVIHVMIGNIISMTGIENMQFYTYLKPIVIFALSVGVALLVKKILSVKR